MPIEDALRSLLQITYHHVSDMEKLVSSEYSKSIVINNTPCGMYAISKTLVNNFFNASGIDLPMLKNFIAHMPLSETGKGFVATNPFYNLLLIYILTFMANDNFNLAITTSRYYASVTCGVLKAKYFNICDEEVMNFTLANVHGGSTVKNGYIALITKVGDETLEKYAPKFTKSISINAYYRYIVDVRNKLNQSIHIIAKNYYKHKYDTTSLKIDEISDKAMNKFSSITGNDDVVYKIAMFAELSEYELELLFLKIEHDENAMSIFQNLIKNLIRLYGISTALNKDNFRSLIFRARRTESILIICQDILSSIDEDGTLQNCTALIMLSLILISVN